MKQAVKKGVAQDVELVQLAIPKNAALAVKLKNVNEGIAADIHYAIEKGSGYLLKDGQRIPMPGKPNFFVTVLELEQP
jgi:hypothetical protein